MRNTEKAYNKIVQLNKEIQNINDAYELTALITVKKQLFTLLIACKGGLCDMNDFLKFAIYISL